MRIGLIGSGNMARAIAVGWDRPVTCSALEIEQAEALAALVGGTAAASNSEVAANSDLVILCHKPKQLEEVAAEIAGQTTLLLSILAGVTVEQLRAAYPNARVFRIMPNLAVEIAQATIGIVDDDAGDPELFAEVVALLAELGDVVPTSEADFAVLTGISGVGPAYLALVAQKQVEAAVAEGMNEATAKVLVGSTLKGSSALLVARSNDSEQICREVATPGGVTEKGLAALSNPLGEGFKAAMDAVLGRSK
jgi:pyrroline-5-carboxylate reductase